MPNLIDPTTDFALSKLFGSNTDRSKRMLLLLINAFAFPKETKIVSIKEIEVFNPYNMGDYEPDKESILDIKAFDNTGTWYNVEMQCSADPQYFKRALYYWSKVYASNIKKGDDYQNLTRTIGIHFLDFDCIKSLKSKYHNVFGIANLYDPEVDVYGTDMLEIHLIELRKFTRQDISIKTSTKEWTQFLIDPEKCLKENNLKTEEVKEALDDLDKLKLKGKEKEYYEASLKHVWQQNTLIRYAIEEGLAKDFKKGEEMGLKKGEEMRIAKGRQEGEKASAMAKPLHISNNIDYWSYRRGNKQSINLI